MTLLHVAAGNTYGGIERMLVTLAATRHPSLAQQFAVSFGGRLEQELQAAGVPVYRLPSPRASRPMMIWRARRAFAALQAKIAPDAVVFHSAWPHAMFAAAARSGGGRVGFWQHHPISAPAWPDRWARLVRPDFAIFNSAFTAERPAFPGVPGHVIHCPVPEAATALASAERDARRRRAGVERHDVLVLMAARLERLKGHDVLIRAAQLLPADSALKIWIAGGATSSAETAYRDELARAAAALPPGRLQLLGERSDVDELMQLADVYCQPNTKGEGFGIAIAEAMRAGLPCVVSAAGGAAELLDDTCGVVTPVRDAEAVAEALRQLERDPARRAAMGRAARTRAAGLTDPAGRLEQLADVMAARVA